MGISVALISTDDKHGNALSDMRFYRSGRVVANPEITPDSGQGLEGSGLPVNHQQLWYVRPLASGEDRRIIVTEGLLLAIEGVTIGNLEYLRIRFRSGYIGDSMIDCRDANLWRIA